jgi:hypothetical protein
VEGAMSEMRADINVLRQQLGRVALNPILAMDPDQLWEHAAPPSLEGMGRGAALDDGGHGSGGHRGFPQHRRMSMEGDLALTTPSAMGTSSKQDLTQLGVDFGGGQCRGGHDSPGSYVPRPKMDFPVFEGERPKTWKRKCESYFCVFSTSPEHWFDTAMMHFSGGALLWLENCGVDVEHLTWEGLCARVCDQFGRDEFQKLLKQLFHLKQSGFVAEYVQEFTELMHSLQAHTTAWDPELFPSRFVDGLRDEIKRVVIVHQPRNLDAVVSLALL